MVMPAGHGNPTGTARPTAAWGLGEPLGLQYGGYPGQLRRYGLG